MKTSSTIAMELSAGDELVMEEFFTFGYGFGHIFYKMTMIC